MQNLFLVIDASSILSFGTLTKHRVPGAIPILSKYRIVDFSLSAAVSSNIKNVGIFCDRNYRSLQDHIGSGSRYNLNRRRDGIFLLPPKTISATNEDFLSFKRMKEHDEYFIRSDQEYVIITPSTMVWFPSLDELLKKHIKSKKDISQVISLTGERLYTFILKKETLMEYVMSFDSISFKNIVEVFDYSHNESKNTIIYSSYARYLRSDKDYYKVSLDFLKNDNDKFYQGVLSLKTKDQLDSNTYFSQTAKVSSSIFATGSLVSGTVDNSIISRRVEIRKKAKVINSIIMNNSLIEEGATVENAILDKETIVKAGSIVKGTYNEPFISEKKQIVYSSILPKVAMLSAECSPYIKRGGLADMVGSLSLNLSKLGAEVSVFIPLYEEIKQKFMNHLEKRDEVRVKIDNRDYVFNVYIIEKEKITYYFVDLYMYFNRKEVYGYRDDPERFSHFTYLTLEYINSKKMDIDIFHIHDWHMCLLPLMKKKYPLFDKTKAVLTIHNLNYQGEFDKDLLNKFNLDYKDEYSSSTFLGIGISSADEITTVSKTYALELSYEYYSGRLRDLLLNRVDNLYGILNGLDERIDPSKDLEIKAQYNIKNVIKNKEINKKFLMDLCSFKENDNAFIMGMVSRINDIKGFDLVVDALYTLLEDKNFYFVLLGVGDEKLMNSLRALEKKYPNQVKLFLDYYGTIPSYIYSGADIFLMPSRIEPCGTGQMIALKYGTIPVVRQTGGLNDTIFSFDPLTKKGNGFKFYNLDYRDLMNTIRLSNSIFLDKELWNTLIKNAMKSEYSFTACAKEYLKIYNLKDM